MLGSSVSFTIEDDSVHIKEKPKALIDNNKKENKSDEERWWIKKPNVKLKIASENSTDAKKQESSNLSPDISTSMREFLNKESMCKVSILQLYT